MHRCLDFAARGLRHGPVLATLMGLVIGLGIGASAVDEPALAAVHTLFE